MEKKEILAFIKALQDYNFDINDIVYYLVKIINCNLCPFNKECLNLNNSSCKDILENVVKGVIK